MSYPCLKVKQLLREKDITDAIFASSNNMAFRAFKATREISLKIPEDIAITLFKNIDLCSYFDPQLTSINVNGFNIGMIAADILVKLIQDRSIGEIKVLLTPELIIR